MKELPFEAVSFAFRDIWYSVHMPSGEELDLLRGVTGYFEPGTMTALMGSSGISRFIGDIDKRSPKIISS